MCIYAKETTVAGCRAIILQVTRQNQFGKEVIIPMGIVEIIFNFSTKTVFHANLYDSRFISTQLDMDPFSEGPPLHIHRKSDETFMALDKPVTLIENNEVMVLSPGERITAPAGVPHKMFNDTDAPVSMILTDMPVQKLVYLKQLYGFMNESPDNMK